MVSRGFGDLHFRRIEPRKVGEVSNIVLYPIKSCAGIDLDSARLTMRGIETISEVPLRDREYMLVDATPEPGTHHHKFLTQRDRGLQRMALVTPRIRGKALEISWGGQDRIELCREEGEKEIPVRVHRYLTTGVDQGDGVAKMLSNYLCRSVRLVRASGSFCRRASQHYLENVNTLSYQDAYSINWLFSESVTEIQSYLGREVSFRNFRPNLVVSGGSPSLEHLFYHVRFAEVEGVQPKPSARCMIINVDPAKGEMKTGSLPLRAVYDNLSWVDKDGRRQAIFAENFLPQREGVVSRSDDVFGLSTRDPPLIFGPPPRTLVAAH